MSLWRHFLWSTLRTIIIFRFWLSLLDRWRMGWPRSSLWLHEVAVIRGMVGGIGDRGRGGWLTVWMGWPSGGTGSAAACVQHSGYLLTKRPVFKHHTFNRGSKTAGLLFKSHYTLFQWYSRITLEKSRLLIIFCLSNSSSLPPAIEWTTFRSFLTRNVSGIFS